MGKEIKYGTLLLLIVFINTIGFSGYVQANNLPSRARNYSISERNETNENVQIYYNLCAETPKQVAIDNSSKDQDIKWNNRIIFKFLGRILPTEKISVPINTTQRSLFSIQPNSYYIFALRKIAI